MSWLNHPQFVPTRDRVIDALKDKEHSFRKVRSVVFLCGGRDSTPRDRLAQYLRACGDYLVFYAEDVWEVISNQAGLNALEAEARLADLADVVVVIVESPGTFAELGAFALSEPLRVKLLPILDSRHRNTGSFIETGPVRWVDKDSQFAPAVWLNPSTILEGTAEIDERLAVLPRITSSRVQNLADSPKHLLFFVCDIVAIFGPCPLHHVEFYTDQVLDGEIPSVSVDMLLGLAVAMNLITIVPSREGSMFFRPPVDGKLPTYRKTKYLHPPEMRAQVWAALQRIEEGQAALRNARGTQI